MEIQLNLKFTRCCFCFSFFTISHLVHISSELVRFQCIHFLWWYIVLVENFIYWLCPLLNLLLVREHDKRISGMLLHLSYIVLDTQISYIQFCILHHRNQFARGKNLQIKCLFIIHKYIILIKINHSLHSKCTLFHFYSFGNYKLSNTNRKNILGFWFGI